MNIDLMIKKLDSIPCRSSISSVSFGELREILEAGREPHDKKDTIEIDREIAEEWLTDGMNNIFKTRSDENLFNELRKALNERKG